ncbi:MAG: hypothetical protein JWM85_2003 [Acidimicrobiaceae bacterium]|nr:hypothetical protein [Acidimicrobiaceae bacterium]
MMQAGLMQAGLMQTDMNAPSPEFRKALVSALAVHESPTRPRP